MQSKEFSAHERLPLKPCFGEVSLEKLPIDQTLSLPLTPELLETQLGYNFKCLPLLNALVFGNNSKRHQTSGWIRELLVCPLIHDVCERIEFVGDAFFNLLAYRWGSHLLPDQVSEFHVSQVKSNSFLCKIGSNLRVRNLFDCNPIEKEMADRVEVLFRALFFDAGFSTAKRVTTDLVREPFMRTFGMPLPYSDKPLTSFWQVSSVGAFVIELVLRADMVSNYPKMKFTSLRLKYEDEIAQVAVSASNAIRLQKVLQMRYEVGLKFQQKGLHAAAEIVRGCRTNKWNKLDGVLPRKKLQVSSNLWREL